MSCFLEDVDIKKVLVSNKISFDEKNYKYFIGQGYKLKPLHKMLPKKVKMMGKLNECIF